MTVKLAQFYKGWNLQAVFGDGKQWCPVCGSRNFTSYEPAGGLFCDQCGARFACRDTAGDPGLVVDCFPAGYDEHGIFKGRAVKFWIDPARGDNRGVAFWQVLKDCNGGLDDRAQWCASFKTMRHITAPVGTELFQFTSARIPELVQDRIEGLYRREQCERVFDDSYLIHTCIPLSGQTPVIAL